MDNAHAGFFAACGKEVRLRLVDELVAGGSLGLGKLTDDAPEEIKCGHRAYSL